MFPISWYLIVVKDLHSCHFWTQHFTCVIKPFLISINDHISSSVLFVYGVPQGSNLSPVLFAVMLPLISSVTVMLMTHRCISLLILIPLCRWTQLPWAYRNNLCSLSNTLVITNAPLVLPLCSIVFLVAALVWPQSKMNPDSAHGLWGPLSSLPLIESVQDTLSGHIYIVTLV